MSEICTLCMRRRCAKCERQWVLVLSHLSCQALARSSDRNKNTTMMKWARVSGRFRLRWHLQCLRMRFTISSSKWPCCCPHKLWFPHCWTIWPPGCPPHFLIWTDLVMGRWPKRMDIPFDVDPVFVVNLHAHLEGTNTALFCFVSTQTCSFSLPLAVDWPGLLVWSHSLGTLTKQHQSLTLWWF